MTTPLFLFDEIPESRQSTFQPATQTNVFRACGIADDSIVRAYAVSATPSTLFTVAGVLYRQDIRLDPDGNCRFKVSVPYGTAKHETGSYTFNFDTTGTTIKIKAAKAHVAEYIAAGMLTDNPYKGAIGVTDDGKVEGCDIIVPALRLTVTFRHPQGIVGIPFARTLAGATGYTNSDTFLTFNPGELLFAGASGSDGSEAEAEVAYHLIASQNVSNLTVGDIMNIVKKGHDFAWVEFLDFVNVDNQPATKPVRVLIERVYDSISFSGTFGWS